VYLCLGAGRACLRLLRIALVGVVLVRGVLHCVYV
jgi:hypothetical protein